MIQPVRNISTTGRALAAALLAGALLSGCGSSDASGLDLQTPAPENTGTNGDVNAPGASEAPTPSVTPTPSATTSPTPIAPATEEQKVLAAYSAYYDALGPISALPAAERPAALAKLSVDPLYSAAVKELAARDAAGKIVYGQLVVKPVVAVLQGDNAALEDCQDASQFGLMNRATGEKLTVGVKEFKQLSQMKRGADGVWRISAVERTPEAKC